MSSNNRKTLFSIFGIFVVFSIVIFSINFLSSFNSRISDIDVSLKELEKNVLGTATTQGKDLIVTNEIASIDDRDRTNVTVDYKFSVTNASPYRIYNLNLKNSLQTYFGKYNFNLLSVDSPSLTLNSQFDGVNDINLTTGTDEITAGTTKTINLRISFNPEGDLGPFENYVSATGIVDGPTEEESNESNNTAGGSDSTTDGSPTTGSDTATSGSTGDTPIDPQPAGDTSPREVRFILWDAYRDVEMYEIFEGDVIDLSLLNTPFISIEARVTPHDKESVKFKLNGNVRYKYQNGVPFMLEGEDGDDIRPWNFVKGIQNLTAKVYSEQKQEGVVVAEETINFNVTGDFTEEIQTLRDELLRQMNNDYLADEGSGNFFNLDEISNDADVVEIPPVVEEPPIVNPEHVIENEVEEVIDNTPEVTETSNNSEKNGNVLGDQTGSVLAETGTNILLGFLLGIITLSLVILLYKVSNKNSKFL